MSKTVFILGAGASREAGAPLMSELAMDIRDMAGTDGGNGLSAVLNGMNELRATHYRSPVDTKNLEAVFSAFEMAELTGRLGSISNVEGLTDALRDAIQRVLGNAISFPIDSEDGRLKPSPSYRRFVELINFMQPMYGPPGNQPVSVFTFNYDPCLDDALCCSNLGFNYHLTDTNTTGELPLLKLHGSLNWVLCPVCNTVTFWDIGKELAEVQFSRTEIEDFGRSEFKLSKVFDKQHKYKCSHSGPADPFIVPPTYNKRGAHQSIEFVWRAAARELADAENIYVIGFSLPATDQFFRDLLAVGTLGPTELRRFWIFNPDERVEGRFQELKGTGITQAFKFHRKTFSEAIDIIAEAHQVAK